MNITFIVLKTGARTRAYLFPVGTETALLGVEVTEVPSLEKRIVAKPDSGNDMARAESDLLCFSKEFVHATIQG